MIKKGRSGITEFDHLRTIGYVIEMSVYLLTADAQTGTLL